MISFESALELVLQTSFRTGREKVRFTDALNRVLAEDIRADADMPSFNKSAVDGYACRAQDLGSELQVLESIAAGMEPVHSIGAGQCAQIMTGAKLPSGADTVIMVENVIITGANRIRCTQVENKANIRYAGEDQKKGEIILSCGTVVTAQVIGILASVGHVAVEVSTKARVGIISTGDELVEPDQVPSGPVIRNSNAYQLMAQVRNAGSDPTYYGIAADNESSLTEVITRAASGNDITLLTGGVSMGEFDYVPAVLEKAGFDIVFRTINIQPGKPTLFAKKDQCFIFGLPGNPVSSFFQFELLVKPLINKICGSGEIIHAFQMSLGVDYIRKNSSRATIVPVKFVPGSIAIPVEFHGSGHLNSLAGTDGIILVQPGKEKLWKGEIVDVRPV